MVAILMFNNLSDSGSLLLEQGFFGCFFCLLFVFVLFFYKNDSMGPSFSKAESSSWNP